MSQAVIKSPPRKTAPHRDRSVRVERIVNVRLLATTAIVGLVACIVGFLWYSYRSERVTEAVNERALALEKDGEWNLAIGYLNRYLQQNPNDLEARVRLIKAMEQTPQSAARRRRIIGILYQTLGMAPERQDLRLKLANHLLETRDFAAAEAEAKKLDSSATEEDQRAARRIIALSLRARARRSGVVSIEQAANALTAALAEDPDDVTLALSTAELYRQYPQEVGIADSTQKADEIMDRLIAARPTDPEALIARYQYRRRYAVEADAKQDLMKILAEDPSHIEALWLLANEEMASGDEASSQTARQKFRKLTELSPDDPRGYLGLARLLLAEGNVEEGVEVLRNGRAKVSGLTFELDALLAGMLIDLDQLDEAGQTLEDFEKEFRALIPELSSDDRLRLENTGRLLRARLDIARGEFRPATRTLHAILASVGEARGPGERNERLHAHAMLAGAMTSLGRLELAAAHWEQVADEAPNILEARWKAGAAYLDLGRSADAIEQIEMYLEEPSASDEAWIYLVQAHLQQQTRLAPEQRNWSEFKIALEQARSRLPDRWEPQVAEVYYWLTLETDEAKSKTTQQLRQLEKSHPQNGALLGKVALAYQQLGLEQDAERALTAYEAAESDPTQQVLVESALMVQQGRHEEAIKLLDTSSIAAAATADRQELQLTKVKLLAAANQLEAAQQAISELIAAAPREAAFLTLGIEIALARENFAEAKRLEDALKQLSTADDFDWRFWRASRLMGQFANLDRESRAELSSLMNSLRSDRPDWHPLLTLTGLHAELTGDRRQAIEAYQQSVELGEQRPEIVERLVAALYAEGRYNEANSYLNRLNTDQAVDGRAESLAIALALRENQLDSALAMAQQAVEGGSTDPMHYVWLAHLLSQKNQPADAEAIYRKSIELFPSDARVWNALFTHFVGTEQPDRARRTLDQWVEKVTLDEPSRLFTLGQGFELLGDAELAQDHYQRAISIDPKNIEPRLRLGRLLLSSDVTAARAQFEEILKIDPENSAAKRHTASLLALSGNDSDWSRALELLEAGEDLSGSDDAAAGDRMRAVLLSRRGRTRPERLKNYDAARRILSERLRKSDVATHDLDRMLLAEIFEQEASMRQDPTLTLAARDVLRSLVDRENPPAEYLSTYIQLLLRHLENPFFQEAEPSQQDVPRAALVDDARLRIQELEDAIPKNATAERKMMPVGLRVRLLAAEDKKDDALALLKKTAEKQLGDATAQGDQSRILLELGNLASAIGFHAEAEQWYRQLLMIAPNSYFLLAKSLIDQKKFDEAAKVCLAAAKTGSSSDDAVVLAQLLSVADDDDALHEKINPVVEQALATDGDNVQLLMSVAVQRVTEGEYEEAIKLFRRVLRVQPNNTLALNNLATLLAEQPNQLADARKYTLRAIDILGRNPALLDTLGTILTRMGRHEEAVAALEEAVAGVATDPRYYFHLAVAYQSSGRREEAQTALETARKFGLDRAILTSGDKEILASLQSDLLTATGSRQ